MPVDQNLVAAIYFSIANNRSEMFVKSALFHDVKNFAFQWNVSRLCFLCMAILSMFMKVDLFMN